jgi:O-antigen/teichoic acid export membrane protein
MNLNIKRLLGQTATYGLSSIVGRLLNYLLVPLYTSSAVFSNPSDYGVVSELYSWVAFFVVFLPFGMETAFFRFLQSSDDKEKVFSNSFLSVLAINIIFYFGLLYFNTNLASFMLYEGHNEYIVLLGAIVCIDAIASIPIARLRAEEKALRFTIIQLISIGVNISLNLILLLGFFDPARPEEGVLFILIANLCASLVKIILVYDIISKVVLKIDWALIKVLLTYSFPLVIAGLAGIVNETIDRILLKQLLYDPLIPGSLQAAEAEVGIYSACYKLAMLVTILLQAYRYAAEPFFFEQLKNEDRNNVYSKIMNLFIAVVCFVFLAVSVNVSLFKYFIRSEIYWEGLKVVPILLLANVFLGIYYNQSIWYKLSGKTKFGAYIAIVGALFTIGINLLFIPKFGFMACAWATLIVYALQMMLSYFLGQKHYKIPYNTTKFAVYIGVAVLFFLIFTLARLFFNVALKDVNWSLLMLGNTLLFVYVLLVVTLEKRLLKRG